MSIDFKALAAPFPVAALEWRVGQQSKDKKKATLLAYLTARAVQTRLDEVVGPAHWRDSCTPLYDGGKLIGFLCTLELEVESGQWVGKTDVSDMTDFEALKGGMSGALKRAAVKWGVGRYLYDLDARYHTIVEGYGPAGSVYCTLSDGKSPGHIVPPKLPAWALPEPEPTPAKSDSHPEQQPQPSQAHPASSSDPATAAPAWSAEAWSRALAEADAHVTIDEVLWYACRRATPRAHPRDLNSATQAKALAWYTSSDGYVTVRKAVDLARAEHRNAFFGRWSKLFPTPRVSDEASDAAIQAAKESSNEARRAVLRAWYDTDSLKTTGPRAWAGKHGTTWLRDTTDEAFAAAVDEVIGAPGRDLDADTDARGAA